MSDRGQRLLKVQGRCPRLVLLVALLCALVGCGSGQGRVETSQDRPAKEGTPATSVPAETLAFIAYSGRPPSDARRIDRAIDDLTGRCMRGQGFYYPKRFPKPPKSRQEPGTIIAPASLQAQLAHRRRWGFGIYADIREARTGSAYVPPLDRYVQSLPQARQDAYARAQFGDPNRVGTIVLPDGGDTSFPTSGCHAEAQTRIYGSARIATEISLFPQMLLGQALAAAERSREVRATLQPWSDCMREKVGKAWPEPVALRRSLRAEMESKEASGDMQRREIRLALADAHCASRVKGALMFRQAFIAAINRLPSRQIDQVVRLQTKQRRAATKARAYLRAKAR